MIMIKIIMLIIRTIIMKINGDNYDITGDTNGVFK